MSLLQWTELDEWTLPRQTQAHIIPTRLFFCAFRPPRLSCRMALFSACVLCRRWWLFRHRLCNSTAWSHYLSATSKITPSGLLSFITEKGTEWIKPVCPKFCRGYTRFCLWRKKCELIHLWIPGVYFVIFAPYITFSVIRCSKKSHKGDRVLRDGSDDGKKKQRRKTSPLLQKCYSLFFPFLLDRSF